MNKKVIRKISLILILLLCILSGQYVYANSDLESKISLVEYTKEYQDWLNLSDEEKQKVLEPRRYDIVDSEDNETYIKGIKNPFKVHQLLKATVSSKYNLKDVIPENVKIKDQKTTQSCWSFASLATLETNLAMQDKSANKSATEYDFSERHMDYATTRSAFLNNKINEYGYTRNIKSGGNFLLAMQYIANGMGAIAEKDMPFEDNQDNIDISKIQNKTVKTTLYDTVEFPNDKGKPKSELIQQMKEYIASYGGIYAGIYGASGLSEKGYNNETGAIYYSTKDKKMDHAVVIIGYDDNYSKNNFKEGQRPTADGAWIVKNSWGEKIEKNISEVKEQMFKEDPETYKAMGYQTASSLPNEAILNTCKKIYGNSKAKLENNKLVIEVGDKGYMYISYEDSYVYDSLYGIKKAKNTKDYGKIYQNDILGPSCDAELKLTSAYIANVFKRDLNTSESVDKVSIYTNQEQTCKVLINPANSNKSVNDLKEVKLKDGDTAKIHPGYNVIEFAEPITLTGDSFVTAIKLIDDGTTKKVALESPKVKDGSNGLYQNAVVNAGESFFTNDEGITNNQWRDIGTAEGIEGNLCIKAYTTANSNGDNEKNDISSPEGDKKAVSSSFDDAKSKVTESKMYFSSKDLNNSSNEITIKITGIKIGDESNSYTYSYYLSNTKGDKNITNWQQAQAQKESDGTYSITLDLKSSEIENYETLTEAENLYIYIKERATLGDSYEEQTVTLDTENTVEPKCYVDDKYVGGIDDVLNYNKKEELDNTGINSETNKGNGDTTVSSKILPFAGNTAFKIGIVLFLILIGGFAFYRYKNIDK